MVIFALGWHSSRRLPIITRALQKTTPQFSPQEIEQHTVLTCFTDKTKVKHIMVNDHVGTE